MTTCPALVATLRDLHIAIGIRHDEIKSLRVVLPSTDVEGLVALHRRPRTTDKDGNTPELGMKQKEW